MPFQQYPNLLKPDLKQNRVTVNLSKSLFIKGLQCTKALWLQKHRPDLMQSPDTFSQNLIEQGTQIGKLATQLFPGGESISPDWPHPRKIQTTRAAIKKRVSAIYEATFSYNQILIMADILVLTDLGWEVFEVKSGTGKRDIHLMDLALQYYVIRQSGLPLKRASLIHINHQYTRGAQLHLPDLFQILDVTEQVMARQTELPEQIHHMRKVIQNALPTIDIGPHCTYPYDCVFRKFCWQHIPEYSVFNLTNMSPDQKFRLYHKGILSITDIPLTPGLTDAQKLQIQAEQDGEMVIQKDQIRDFLRQLHYPLYFLDFECVQHAVPQFEGTRPFQLVPFQFSLHILNRRGGRLKHKFVFIEPGKDGRKVIARKLTEFIPKSATIVVYGGQLERHIPLELGALFDTFNLHLKSLSEHMVDLITPFERHYLYSPQMKGSHSMKNVLPALVPELNYADLAIHHGGQVQMSYITLSTLTSATKFEQLKSDIIRYNELDTLAMVRILEKLQELVDPLPPCPPDTTELQF